MFMLDTNIISDAMRNPDGAVTRKIAAEIQSRLCTSVIVLCELRFGLAKNNSKKLANQLTRVMSAIPVRPLDHNMVSHYTRVRNFLEQSGKIIGANDLLIAAHALSLDAVLVTDNEKEFSRVPGLRVENWLSAA